jgi:hypothetical protein
MQFITMTTHKNVFTTMTTYKNMVVSCLKSLVHHPLRSGIFANSEIRVMVDDYKKDDQIFDDSFVKIQGNMFGELNHSVYVSENNWGYFIRPVSRFGKLEFEIFFGFGSCNLGYSDKRTIFIPKN